MEATRLLNAFHSTMRTRQNPAAAFIAVSEALHAAFVAVADAFMPPVSGSDRAQLNQMYESLRTTSDSLREWPQDDEPLPEFEPPAVPAHEIAEVEDDENEVMEIKTEEEG
jgi:hypothetical protein